MYCPLLLVSENFWLNQFDSAMSSLLVRTAFENTKTAVSFKTDIFGSHQEPK
jgi:hypothetical protein